LQPLTEYKYAKAFNFKKMGRLGPTEIILIVLVIVLLFGGKKIPELMKGLGNGIKEFKNASKEDSTATTSKKEETKE
jgi:sec-independent protein translocase protein TatA